MVSDDDGRNWETRSSLDLRDLRDLVVSPADPETLLATTAAGPMRSGDGGRTWAQPPGAPTLTVLAWASPESLYGAAPSGQLWHSADAGTTWTPCGAVTGEPEALLLDRRDGLATVYVAVLGQGILASTDGGSTFTVRYAEWPDRRRGCDRAALLVLSGCSMSVADEPSVR